MKYDDIINETWPKPTRRGWMTVSNRAKIFLPFAALKTFESTETEDLEVLPHFDEEQVQDLPD